jgi:LacI family transcriptional regulator
MPRPPVKTPAKSKAPSKAIPGQKVSLKTLAEHLGLSRTTVSLILNDAPLAKGFSPETRRRVLQAAKNFSYRPNYFARSLTHMRTYLIGVIAPDFSSGYDSSILSGIEGRLLNTDYTYFVSSHLWSPTLLSRNVEMLVDRGAEGLLLINTALPSAPGIPTVNICAESAPAGASRIFIDNLYGVNEALKHLVSLRHTRIAFFKGHEGSADTEERWRAVQRTCRKLGVRVDPALMVQLERLEKMGTQGIEEGKIAAEKLLARGCPFTALLAFNDMSAFGAMNALREAGYNLPQDISVMGFDDIEFASIMYPPLTTVRQPLRMMGESAAEILLRKIENSSTSLEDLRIRPQLVVRASTCPAPAADRGVASAVKRNGDPHARILRKKQHGVEQ